MTDTEIVVTGTGWLGEGVGGLQQGVYRVVSAARGELQVTAFSVTQATPELWSRFEDRLDAGVALTMVVNRLDSQQPQARERLSRWLAAHGPRFRLWDFDDPGGGALHAKLIVADRQTAFIGSANLTFSGMVGSHELGVVLSGEPAATVSYCIDRLLQQGPVRQIG